MYILKEVVDIHFTNKEAHSLTFRKKVDFG